MATNNHDDALRNPAVDYDRSDLSPRGILLFLAGLLIAGVFIEIVIWGMFRFLSHSTLFAQGNPSPMGHSQTVTTENVPGVRMQNAPDFNTNRFPAPRLQTNDVVEMNDFFASERKVLNPQEPFTDKSGNIHIPITEAMKLIEQRGLPVRPSTPPPDFTAQTDAGNAAMAQKEAQTHSMAKPDAGAKNKHAAVEPKQ